jgi:hypothetical protein
MNQHLCHFRFLWRTPDDEIRYLCHTCCFLMIRGKLYAPL